MRPDEPSDEQLMARYRGGDDQAFARLFERYRARLRRFIGRTAPAAADADEIAQETWLAVIKRRDRYLIRARFATYLFAIAHRRTQDRWRRFGRRAEVGIESAAALEAPREQEPPQEAALSSLQQALAAALAELAPAQREAFLLRAEGGLALDEIAAVMESGRETTKSRLRYAYRHLRAQLEQWQA